MPGDGMVQLFAFALHLFNKSKIMELISRSIKIRRVCVSHHIHAPFIDGKFFLEIELKL